MLSKQGATYDRFFEVEQTISGAGAGPVSSNMGAFPIVTGPEMACEAPAMSR